jgi:hypothetical protein
MIDHSHGPTEILTAYKHRRIKMRKLTYTGYSLLGLTLTSLIVLPAVAQRGPRMGRGPNQQGRQQDAPPQSPAGQQQSTQDQQPPVREQIPADLTAEELADWCMTRATELADACTVRMQNTADEAMGIIDVLFDYGSQEQIYTVARWSLHMVNDDARRCGRQIHRLSARCTRAIYRAGGSNELIEQMWAHCLGEVERVAETRAVVVDQIVTAGDLPVPEEDEDLLPPPPPAD